MGAGSEFEYSEQELRLLVKLLTENVEDPIEQIKKIEVNSLLRLRFLVDPILC